MNRRSLEDLSFSLLFALAAVAMLLLVPAVRAGDIDRLAVASSGQTVVYEYLSATLPEEARRELTHALKADHRFARGEPARELALRALASLVLENGRLALEERGQVSLLLEAAADHGLSVHTRTEVIQRMPVMAELAPDETAKIFRELLGAEDPSVLLSTLDAVARWDGLDETYVPGLLSIATDPVNSIPTAWALAGEKDRRDAEKWGGGAAAAGISSLQSRIRGLAAAAWMMASDPREVHDFLRDHQIESGEIWTGALVATLIPPQSPFWTAEIELQRKWLELLAILIERPDTIAVAECCTIPVLIHAASRRPDLIGHIGKVLEQVGKTHGGNAQLLRQTEEGLELLELIRTKEEEAGGSMS